MKNIYRAALGVCLFVIEKREADVIFTRNIKYLTNELLNDQIYSCLLEIDFFFCLLLLKEGHTSLLNWFKCIELTQFYLRRVNAEENVNIRRMCIFKYPYS